MLTQFFLPFAAHQARVREGLLPLPAHQQEAIRGAAVDEP